MKQTALLPVMVSMTGRYCLVVGGGRVAERKIAALLEAGAAVTVISPNSTESIKRWAIEGQLHLEEREYVSGEGEAAFLIIAATDQLEVNQRLTSEALERGQLVNSVSKPQEGSVLLPAVLRRGLLTVAVSTSGTSPASAVAIRDRIDTLLGEDAERLLVYAEGYRRKITTSVSDPVLRRQLLKRLVGGDVFHRISTEGWQTFEAEMKGLLEEAELTYKDEGRLEQELVDSTPQQVINNDREVEG